MQFSAMGEEGEDTPVEDDLSDEKYTPDYGNKRKRSTGSGRRNSKGSKKTTPKKRQKKQASTSTSTAATPKAKTPNAFILFSLEKRHTIAEQNKDISNAEISRLLGVAWRKLHPDEKRKYKEQAKEAKEAKEAAKERESSTTTTTTTTTETSVVSTTTETAAVITTEQTTSTDTTNEGMISSLFAVLKETNKQLNQLSDFRFE